MGEKYFIHTLLDFPGTEAGCDLIIIRINSGGNKIYCDDDYNGDDDYDGDDDYNGDAEAEKTRRRVGMADRKVFARQESFCAYNRKTF